MNHSSSALRTTLLTAFALTAFAANSVLCRLALGKDAIDAGSFTNIRLVSGIVVLLLLVSARTRSAAPLRRPSWVAPFTLFLYAVAFSYAYITLETGTGALILFTALKITILVMAVARGHRLNAFEGSGLVVAFAGFVYLVLPTLSTPSLLGFVLMTVAGASFGVYTLHGKGSRSPLIDTSQNFTWTWPLVLILAAVTFKDASLTGTGVLLAVLSGGLCSGIGYAVWYAALPGLSATQAAVVQLLSPLIAAGGGIWFSQEALTLRFVTASALILGGILLVALKQNRSI